MRDYDICGVWADHRYHLWWWWPVMVRIWRIQFLILILLVWRDPWIDPVWFHHWYMYKWFRNTDPRSGDWEDNMILREARIRRAGNHEWVWNRVRDNNQANRRFPRKFWTAQLNKESLFLRSLHRYREVRFPDVSYQNKYDHAWVLMELRVGSILCDREEWVMYQLAHEEV